ncbi:MAG TPA: hypothetical protein VF702_00530 [Allosphingosinicella sp.]
MRDAAARDPEFAALAPPDALRPAVKALHYHSEPAQAEPFRRLPGPFAALVVSLDSPGRWRPAGAACWRPYPRIALHGLATRWSASLPMNIGRTRRLVALIEPWAVAPLFGIPGNATVDCVVDIETKLPRWTRKLLRGHVYEHHAAGRLAALGAAVGDLLRLSSPAQELSLFLKMARDSGGGVRIGEAARAVDIGERQLRSLVAATIGVSPKAWCSIVRFSANLRRLHPSAFEGAPSIPPSYFDQAHEIREFRSLAGMTPGAYRASKQGGDRRVYAA